MVASALLVIKTISDMIRIWSDKNHGVGQRAKWDARWICGLFINLSGNLTQCISLISHWLNLSYNYRNTKVYAVRFHLYKIKLIYSDRNRSGFLAGRLRRQVKDYEDPFEENEEICILLIYVCKNPSNCTFQMDIVYLFLNNVDMEKIRMDEGRRNEILGKRICYHGKAWVLESYRPGYKPATRTY